MTTVAAPPTPAPSSPRFDTALQWHHSLGGIPLERILFEPRPGSATVDDVVRLAHADEKRLAELVNHTLVEKPVGYKESITAGNILFLLKLWAEPERRGVVSGEQGMIQMNMGNVRMPDVAFVRREDLPGGEIPSDPAPRLRPTLAVEVLSRSNTDEEMRIKVREYFDNGAELVWLVNPEDQTLRVYEDAERFRQLTRDDPVDGGETLPGFSTPVADLFRI